MIKFLNAYVKSMRLYYSFVTGIAGWIGVSYYQYVANTTGFRGTSELTKTIEMKKKLAQKTNFCKVLIKSGPPEAMNHNNAWTPT